MRPPKEEEGRKMVEQMADVMQGAERRLGTCIDWRQFKIVMSYEAYKLLQSETCAYQFVADVYGDHPKTIFDCKLEIDANAKEAFAFVSDGLKFAPCGEELDTNKSPTVETSRRHDKELNLVAGDLWKALAVLRMEAYEFRHGTLISPCGRNVANIMPIDCDRLADFFSAIADCIEKHIEDTKEGAKE